MASSGSFNKLGGMTSGPADLFGLTAFNLYRTESSQTRISDTEGTEQSMRSLSCAGKSVVDSFVSRAHVVSQGDLWWRREISAVFSDKVLPSGTSM